MQIIDNLCRRRIDEELGCLSLTPISSPEERLEAWKQRSGKTIPIYRIDVARDYDSLRDL